MAAELTPVPKFRAFDADGEPLAGGKLYAYTAGTTTPLDTYTSDTGGVANTNPVILDANGEANVWLGSASYKLILKNSADVQQWSVDNINAAVTGTGSKVRATSPTLITPALGVATATSLAIGSGSVITKSLSASFTYDFPNILANTCVDSTAQTLTGAVDGDAVFVGVLAAGISAIQIQFSAYVNAANQVKVRACNPTAGAIDPGSTTFRVVVLRF